MHLQYLWTLLKDNIHYAQVLYGLLALVFSPHWNSTKFSLGAGNATQQLSSHCSPVSTSLASGDQVFYITIQKSSCLATKPFSSDMQTLGDSSTSAKENSLLTSSACSSTSILRSHTIKKIDYKLLKTNQFYLSDISIDACCIYFLGSYIGNKW